MQPGAECGEGGGQDGDASDHRLVSGDKSVSMRIFYDSHHSTTGYVCTEMTRLAATVMEVRLGNLSLTQVIFGSKMGNIIGFSRFLLLNCHMLQVLIKYNISQITGVRV